MVRDCHKHTKQIGMYLHIHLSLLKYKEGSIDCLTSRILQKGITERTILVTWASSLRHYI